VESDRHINTVNNDNRPLYDTTSKSRETHKSEASASPPGLSMRRTTALNCLDSAKERGMQNAKRGLEIQFTPTEFSTHSPVFTPTGLLKQIGLPRKETNLVLAVSFQ
jgi:hypothetical protein